MIVEARKVSRSFGYCPYRSVFGLQAEDTQASTFGQRLFSFANFNECTDEFALSISDLAQKLKKLFIFCFSQEDELLQGYYRVQYTNLRSSLVLGS